MEDKSKRGVVIGDIVDYGDRFFGIEDGKVIKVKSVKDATKFKTIEEANKFIVDMEIENFGITVLHFVKSGKNMFLRGGERVITNDIRIKNEDITEQAIINMIGYNYVDLENSDNVDIFTNRIKYKSEIMSRIGKLIDIHNSLETIYAKMTSPEETKQGVPSGIHHCKGCIICYEIEDCVKFLNKPQMQRKYSILIEMEGYFDEYIAQQKNRKDFSNVTDLVKLFKDYKYWVNQCEMTVKEISQFAKVNIERLKLMIVWLKRNGYESLVQKDSQMEDIKMDENVIYSFLDGKDL